jgi:hypothetical protein
MSLKTLIVFAIFGALMFLYIVYMSGEYSKSSKKLEAFEEAASSLKSDLTNVPTVSRSNTTTSTTSTTGAPSTSTTSTTTGAPSTSTTSTTTGAPTSEPTPTTSTPTVKKQTPVKDLEKTLYIVNAYEEIYGTKIGPEELEELNNMFADVEDRDVIFYKLKELRSQSTEVDAIFELVDISNKLGSIVNRLKARAGARAEVQVSNELISKGATTTSGPTTTTSPTTTTNTVEGYRPLPKYLSF